MGDGGEAKVDATVVRRVLQLNSGAFSDVDAASDGAPGTVALAPADDVRTALQRWQTASGVVLTLPKPADGRAYSQAQQLRELGFTGRIRLVGAVLVDALPFVRGVGIDEVILRDAHEEPFAQAALRRFSTSYQGR